MEPTLWLGITLGFASAVLFALVGRTIRRKPVSHEVESARNAFVVWWVTLSALSFIAACMTLVANAVPDPDGLLVLFETLTFIVLGLICLAFWGLLYYLLFLYTNSTRIRVPLAVGYTAFFFYFVYYILALQPTGVEVTALGAQLQFAQPQDPTSIGSIVLGLLFIVPILLSAAGYLSLYRKVSDPLQRKRILIVGTSIFLWFGTSLPGIGRDLSNSTAWQIVTRVVGLVATIAIYYAYAGLEPKAPEASATPGKGPATSQAAPPARPKADIA